MQQTKKKLPSLQSDTFFEQFRNLSSETSGSFEQMTPPEKVERKEIQKQGAYDARQEFILFSAREQETAREIEALRQELEMVVKTVKEVDFEVQKAVMEIPVKAGVYHVRFLERIRRLLKLVREKLEDSRTWLRLSTSKRKQRSYWAMYKKKGTSFGLSGERVVSTQTG